MPEITLGGRAIAYRVVRSPRARLIRIRVGPAGVVVSAPRGTRDGTVAAALRRQADWLLGAVAVREAVPGPHLLRAGDAVPFLGGLRRVGTQIPVPPHGDVAAAVEAWYRAQARRHLTDVVRAWAPRMGVTVRRVTVRGQRSRWGSASTSGTVSLNWRLMMAPPDVAEYVVVHELAHLRHMDHSPAFWGVVAAHLPGHRAQRDWLRRNGDALLAGPAPVSATAPG